MPEYIMDGRIHELPTPEPVTGFLAQALLNLPPHPRPAQAEAVEGEKWFILDGLAVRVRFVSVMLPYTGKYRPMGGALFAAEGPYEGRILDADASGERVKLSVRAAITPYITAYAIDAS